MTAGLAIDDSPHFHIWMEDRRVLHAFEVEAEKLTRHPEERLLQKVELEMLRDLLHVQVEAVLPDLLCVIAVIPRLQAPSLPRPPHHLLRVGDLLPRASQRRRPDRLQQLHRALRRLRHLALDREVRMGGVAAQFGALGT